MKNLLKIVSAFTLIIFMQSCVIKGGPNMKFAKSKDLPKGTEIVSINVPRILVKAVILSKIKSLKKEDPIAAAALKKIKSIKIMTISGTEKSNLEKSNLYNSFNSYLSTNNFQELISLQHDRSDITINTKSVNSRIKNVLLGIKDDDDYVFVDLKTNFNMDEINKLITHYEEVERNASAEKKSAKVEEENLTN